VCIVSFSIPLPVATSSICLLDEDNEERLFLHKTGYKFLQSCPDNLCVTSIIGLFLHLGLSSLLCSLSDL
jgi:hypothetical protein